MSAKERRKRKPIARTPFNSYRGHVEAGLSKTSAYIETLLAGGTLTAGQLAQWKMDVTNARHGLRHIEGEFRKNHERIQNHKLARKAWKKKTSNPSSPSNKGANPS